MPQKKAIRWSPQQEAAITHDTSQSGSAIVSAAAGSGKTAMLVERITRLITDTKRRIPADRIAAVTFTNDAAGELKSRLEAAVSARLHNADDEWLTQQLINLESAKICTISSFCVSILRDYAQELGLAPGFRICEGKEREHYLQRASAYALDTLYTDEFSDDERGSLYLMTGEAADTKLENALLDLLNEYEKQPFPEQWLASCTEPKSGLKDEYEAEIRRKAACCLDEINEALSLSYSESITKKLETDKAFALCYTSFKSGDKPILEHGGGNPGGKVREEFRQAHEAVKALRNAYIPVFKDIIITAGLLYDYDFVSGRQAPQIRALSKLFLLFRTQFTRLKREADCIDFSDAEHLCLELLQDKNVREKLKAQFCEIIVDEFQDSSKVQYEIFKTLSTDSRNLFFVGDVKQSIYRFRNADPSIFGSVADDEKFTLLPLYTNYRSCDEVIGSVNGIFAELMPRYETVEGTGKKGAETELVLIEADGEEDAKTAEAEYIAGRIMKIAAEGTYTYGDIAVLVAGLSTIEKEFTKVFEARGIPFAKQKSGDFSSAEQVDTALALLTVIDRPYEDMQLLTVLMKLYSFTAADIAAIRKNNTSLPLFYNLEACKNNQKAAAVIADLRRYRAYAKNNGACKLIRLIYSEGAFSPLVAASANPEKTMMNIRLLLHYSESLQVLTRDSLQGLIRALSDNGNAVLEEARATSEAGTGRVKLMTIHASKGLEFPVCFVARTNSRFNLRENYSDIIFTGELGFAMRYIIPETRTRCDTLTHRAARRKNEEAAVAEEMRKLYVACTRAKDRLVLTAVAKDGGAGRNTYLEWLQNKLTIKNEQSAITAPVVITKNNKIHDTQAVITAINKIYPREPLTRIPRKVTATQIGIEDVPFAGELQEEPTIFPRMPSFMNTVSGTGKLTGKKRGDAYHKMMELLDFKAGNFEEQIEVSRNRFTPDEFSAVDKAQILGFFNSELGRRAAASANIQKEYKLALEISLSELGYPVEYDELFPNEKPFVQGIADMFFHEDGSIVLVDYKTNKNTTRSKLKEQYRRQLELYERAIEAMTGYSVKEKWIYSFELGEIQLAMNKE